MGVISIAMLEVNLVVLVGFMLITEQMLSECWYQADVLGSFKGFRSINSSFQKYVNHYITCQSGHTETVMRCILL